MSGSKEHFDDHSMERDWPPYMDIFTGPTPVKVQLRKMAENSSRLAPELVADMVGRDLSDQYIYARNHTNTVGMKFILNATTGLANIFANNVMRIAGFAASIWVDVAVFGGAAVNLFGTHMNAFGVGAAIFATWLAMAHDKPWKERILPALCLGIASAGAALILVSQPPKTANDPDFRKPFTELLATQFTRGNTDERTNISRYEGEIAGRQESIRQNEIKLATGGVDGGSMIGDGNIDNDVTVRELEAENRQLRGEIRTFTARKSTEEQHYVTATQKDPVDFWGRIFAALYIGTWLFSSQALVAGIIGQVRANHRENAPKARADAQKRKHLKDFRKFIESSDGDKRRSFMRNAVVSVTTQFAHILYDVAPEATQPAKHDKFAQLFEGETRERIHQIAFDYVDRVVEPRREEQDRPRSWTVFNRESAAKPQPETPSVAAPSPAAEQPAPEAATAAPADDTVPPVTDIPPQSQGPAAPRPA